MLTHLSQAPCLWALLTRKHLLVKTIPERRWCFSRRFSSFHLCCQIMLTLIWCSYSVCRFIIIIITYLYFYSGIMIYSLNSCSELPHIHPIQHVATEQTVKFFVHHTFLNSVNSYGRYLQFHFQHQLSSNLLKRVGSGILLTSQWLGSLKCQNGLKYWVASKTVELERKNESHFDHMGTLSLLSERKSTFGLILIGKWLRDIQLRVVF